MTKIYTENDLLLYLYKDLSEIEASCMELELSQNPSLHEKYLELKGEIEVLDALSEEPSQTSVNLIMEYALALENSKLEKV